MLGVGWFVAVGWLVGVLGDVELFGETPSVAAVARSEHELIAAAVVAIVVPVPALVLRAAARRGAGEVVVPVLLVVACGMVLLVGGLHHQSHLAGPVARSPGAVACQERSGSGTRCPSG